MTRSDLYKKGDAMRRKMYGDAAYEKSNNTVYDDPIMRKFLDVATETVFGALWTRPGLDTKTRALICVVSDRVHAVNYINGRRLLYVPWL